MTLSRTNGTHGRSTVAPRNDAALEARGQAALAAKAAEAAQRRLDEAKRKVDELQAKVADAPNGSRELHRLMEGVLAGHDELGSLETKTEQLRVAAHQAADAAIAAEKAANVEARSTGAEQPFPRANRVEDVFVDGPSLTADAQQELLGAKLVPFSHAEVDQYLAAHGVTQVTQKSLSTDPRDQQPDLSLIDPRDMKTELYVLKLHAQQERRAAVNGQRM